MANHRMFLKAQTDAFGQGVLVFTLTFIVGIRCHEQTPSLFALTQEARKTMHLAQRSSRETLGA